MLFISFRFKQIWYKIVYSIKINKCSFKKKTRWNKILHCDNVRQNPLYLKLERYMQYRIM